MVEFKLHIDGSNLVGRKRSRVLIGDASRAIVRTPITCSTCRVGIRDVGVEGEGQIGRATHAQGIHGVERPL